MTQEELLAEATRLEEAGKLDLDDVRRDPADVRSDRRPQRPAPRPDPRAVRRDPAPLMGGVRRGDAGRAARAQCAVAEFARYIMLWNELTSLVVTDGYRAAERDILARDAEARRGALQELLGVVTADAAIDRPPAPRRRPATASTPTGPTASSRSRRVPRPIPSPERPGIGDEELEVLAGRIGHLLGSTAPGAEGVGAGIRLPAVLPLHGRIAVLARADWAGLARVPAVLDSILGGLAAAAAHRGARGARTEPASPPQAWVAVGSEAIDGVVVARRRPTPTSSTPRARRGGSACGAGSPTRSASPSSDCCSPTARSPTPPSSRSSARSSPTSAWAPSSSRRSRRTSTRARTSRGRASPPPRDADGRLPHGADRVPARLSARWSRRPPTVDGAAGQAAAGRLAVIARRLSGCRRRRTRSAQHRRGTTEAQRGPRQFNG